MAARRPQTLTTGIVASHMGVIMAVSVVIGVLTAGLAVPYLVAFGDAAHQLDNAVRTLPVDLPTGPLAQQSRVLSASGKTIATFYDQSRTDVPLSKIAPVMRRAIVSIEDYRFYEHGALDVKGTLRALLTDAAGGGTTQGGSTITQQLAKMTLLDEARTAKARTAATADTYTRKLIELRHAIALEQHYSKSWILNRYLNIAYFGDGAYGVQSAAKHYFGIDASQLNLQQAALLAGLVKNPVGYSPTLYPSHAKARRQIVLNRMAQLHKISQSTANRLASQPLGLHIHKLPNGCVSSVAPWFCNYVQSYLVADPSLGRTPQDRAELLNNGGLTIKTTLKTPFQRSATKAAQSHVHPTDQAVGAVAEVQPGTGDVYALAQSRPMGTNSKKGQTFLNYAVPTQYGHAAGFQPGSTFKFFTIAAALQEGLPTSTSFYAPQKLTVPQSDYRTCKGSYSGGPWTLSNSTSATNQTMDMFTGAPESVNTYFAQLEKRTGLCVPYRMATQMGLPLPASSQVPSFTLGVADVDPLQMASAYATAAARGIYCRPRPVSEILNNAGHVFKRYPTQCHRVLSKHTADSVNEILHRVLSPGGFGAALMLDKPGAGKTGTTSSNKAVWFNGYTPAVAASSVVAGVNQKGHPISLTGQTIGGTYYAIAEGSTVAGPMWADALRPVENLLPMRNFATPTGGPNQSRVPHMEGQSVAAAKAAIRKRGLTPMMAGEIDSGYAGGEVALLSMGADNHTVYIFTSSGHSAPAPPPPPPPPPAPVHHYVPPAPTHSSGGHHGGGHHGGGHHGGGGGGHRHGGGHH